MQILGDSRSVRLFASVVEEGWYMQNKCGFVSILYEHCKFIPRAVKYRRKGFY